MADRFIERKAVEVAAGNVVKHNLFNIFIARYNMVSHLSQK
jgi:hypothetical protein